MLKDLTRCLWINGMELLFLRFQFHSNKYLKKKKKRKTDGELNLSKVLLWGNVLLYTFVHSFIHCFWTLSSRTGNPIFVCVNYKLEKKLRTLIPTKRTSFQQ